MSGTRHLLLCGITTILAAAPPVGAQSISPPSVIRTISVGETLTIPSAITLGATGATNVDLFFLADNTGSMGSIIGNAKTGAGAILGALPNTYQFGVGHYVGDPSEGVSPNVAYAQNQALTTSKAAAQAGINNWFASGGGDVPEGNFYALQQVATTAGWRPDAQRLLIWFGDAPAHTETTTQAQAIAALAGANVKVVAFNSGASRTGLDESGQASAIAAATNGTLVNNFLSYSTAQFISTVQSQISSATMNIDLNFGSNLIGSGLRLNFACTDVLGCTNVGAGQTRTFNLSIEGVTAGTYAFDVFAQGVSAVQSERITVVTSAVPEPSTVALLAAGLGLVGVAARRRRVR